MEQVINEFEGFVILEEYHYGYLINSRHIKVDSKALKELCAKKDYSGIQEVLDIPFEIKVKRGTICEYIISPQEESLYHALIVVNFGDLIRDGKIVKSGIPRLVEEQYTEREESILDALYPEPVMSEAETKARLEEHRIGIVKKAYLEEFLHKEGWTDVGVDRTLDSQSEKIKYLCKLINENCESIRQEKEKNIFDF